MIKSITFVVGSQIQWKNFAPIYPHLKKNGYEVHVLLLDNYDCSSYEIPRIKNGIKYSILAKPTINKALNFLFRRRFLIRFLPLFSLQKEWKNYLDKCKPRLVVFGVDHSIIHSYMINVCKKKSIKTAVLQDGYMPTRILKGKFWKNQLDLIRSYNNFYLPYTPTPFKSGVNFVGLIGEEAKRSIAPKLDRISRLSVVGSPRYDDFVRQVKENSDEWKPTTRNQTLVKDNVVFLQTNYDDVNKKLEYQQQQAIIWLCEIIQSLNLENKMMVNVYLHTGTRNIEEYLNIQKKFNSNMVLIEGGINPTIIEKCHSCYTFGSTGILDFYLAKVKCAVINSPKTKNPILLKSILEFGFPLIESNAKLIRFLVDESYLLNRMSRNDFLGTKIANFKPNWNSIKKTTKWIISIMESI